MHRKPNTAAELMGIHIREIQLENWMNSSMAFVYQWTECAWKV